MAALTPLHALPFALLPLAAAAAPPLAFEEVAAEVGLAGLASGRVQSVDLDGDGRPDLIVDRVRVFLNRADPDAPRGFRFEPIASGLPDPGASGIALFVDLDGDRVPDAILARHLGGADLAAAIASDGAAVSASIHRGRGDGTFEPGVPLAALPPGPVHAIAAADLDLDGRLDLVIGQSYLRAGGGWEGGVTEILWNRSSGPGAFAFERESLPSPQIAFTPDGDPGGRPTYGIVVAPLLGVPLEGPPIPAILELNYGRRANRLWVREADATGALHWHDRAGALGVDGDAIRHGRYPEWLKERARSDPRFDRTDEAPFRSHGNTFDAAVGDLDGDGRFDLVLAEITHAWAGDSSDRSRVLLRRDGRFEPHEAWSLDRFPTDPEHPFALRWNQGDLFCDLADLTLDGRLEVILASGDYPDPPPSDQRLRIFASAPAGDPSGQRLVDRAIAAGVSHPGAGQIAIADFDGDGRLDLLVGQTFNRFTPELVEASGGTPQVRLFLNIATGPGPANSIHLDLEGDPAQGVATTPYGAIVVAITRTDEGERRQVRLYAAPGGHAGRQSPAGLVIGLGEATRAERLEIRWPCSAGRVTILEQVPPGRHRVRVGD